LIQYLWLIPLGVIIGAFGTLIGAGGGFVLMPILILLYPNEKTQVITSISLAVVFFNALSGSVAYARMRRIDYRSGILFLIATIPGAILGAITTTYIPRHIFDIIFSLLLIASSIYLAITGGKTSEPDSSKSHLHWIRISFTDTCGKTYKYSYNLILGLCISLVVGFASSLLGIGGGVIHVPALSGLLNFPVHIATATSHFILAGTSLTGTIVHITTGAFHSGIRRTICLSIGVLIGAQIGAFYSNRIKGTIIIRALAVALALLGFRILLLAV
jgi:uncharacterized membrane protein YfcA